MSDTLSMGWAEADADVAEAIDFCEYYARQAIELQGRDQPLAANPGEYLQLRQIPLGPGVVDYTVHAPFGVLDFDGPREPPERFGFLHLHQLGTYPGSLGNFAGVNIGVPVITLELPHAGLMPTPVQSQQVWSDMIGWLQRNLPTRDPGAARTSR